jgi:hypothetical protein
MWTKFLSVVVVLAICSTIAFAQQYPGGGGGGGGTGMGGSPSSTRSYSSKGPIIGGVAGGAAAAGLIYWQLHKRKTVIGCVGGDGNTLVSEKDNRTYKVKSKGVALKANQRVEVSGKQFGTGDDLSLEVRQLRKEYGSCKPEEVGLAR